MNLEKINGNLNYREINGVRCFNIDTVRLYQKELCSGFNIYDGFNGPIHDIDIDEVNEWIYVVGNFTQFGTSSYNNIIRLYFDGTADNTFLFNGGVVGGNTDPNGIVYTVKVLDDGKILVGGDFNVFSEDGATNSNVQPIIRINSDGSLDNTYISNFVDDSIIYDIEVDSNGDYIIGTNNTLSIGEFKLLASDGAGVDFFGWSVSTSNNYIVVGAYQDDDNGNNSGSAYVYNVNNLTTGNNTEDFKLLASDGAANDRFGYSVNISGDYVIVGADRDDGFIGSVYIYDINNLTSGNNTEDFKLLASDGASGDTFGVSVSASNNYIVVGALGDSSNAGSAYVYNINNLTTGNNTEDFKLLASDGSGNDFFGNSVSISNNYIVIGAYGDGDNGTSSGSAYVYNINNLTSGNNTEDFKLLASDGITDDFFGWSVSTSNNYIVIGAYQDDDNGTDSGSVYIYDINNLTTGNNTEDFKLLASDGASGDFFGWSVSISNNYVIVGADRADNSVGSAYVYDINNLTSGNNTEDFKLLASDGITDDRFSISVSITDDYIVIGAYGDGNFTGSTYVYNINNNLLHKTNDSGNKLFGFNIMIGASANKVLIDSNNDIVIGGDFSTYNNNIANNIVKIDSDGNLITNYVNGYDDIIYDLYEESDGSLLVGGQYQNKNADYIIENELLLQSDPNNDDFAFSVSISDNYVVVGAKDDDDDGTNSGSVYVYEINNFNTNVVNDVVENYKLRASDGVPNKGFGNDVSNTDTYIVVGGVADGVGGVPDGPVYVYDISNLTVGTNFEDFQLTPNVSDNLFGRTVSVFGDYIVVGGTNTAYVYDINNLTAGTNTQDFKLESTDSTINLGVSISNSNNYIVVGDSNTDRAYVYDINNLTAGTNTQDFRLLPSDASGNFGISVSITDNHVVVGDSTVNSNRGFAYVFNISNLLPSSFNTEDFTLLVSNDNLGDEFGRAVSISGDNIVIGARGYNGVLANSGVACLYNINNLNPGTNTEEYQINTLIGGSLFGQDVSISNNYVIVGKPETAHFYDINDFNYGGFNINSLSRLTNTNTYDPNNTLNQNVSFNPGDIVYSIDKDTSNNIIIGGDYTGYNSYNYIILNNNGSINIDDNQYNDTVYKVKTQSDDKILVGGDYTNYQNNNGDNFNINRLMRLKDVNSNNTIDL